MKKLQHQYNPPYFTNNKTLPIQHNSFLNESITASFLNNHNKTMPNSLLT